MLSRWAGRAFDMYGVHAAAPASVGSAVDDDAGRILAGGVGVATALEPNPIAASVQ
jgi:hypothetical protein